MALNKVPYTDYQTVVTAANMNAIQDEIISTTSLALCNTSPSVASKSAALLNFVLSTGATVKVKFADTNTAANPTLNINSTGAQAIMQYGATPAGTTPNTSWGGGDIVEFVFDGTNWVIVGRNTKEASSTQAGLLSITDKGVIETVGDVANLETTAQSTVVDAINEVVGDIGDLSSLSTTAQSTVVAAVNEVDDNIGDLSSLTTTAQSSVVDAVNEVLGDVGTVDTKADTINGNISDAYSTSGTYKVGELCIYNNTLYRCTTAITTAEAWNSNHWTATTIAEEIENRVLWFSGTTVSATSGNIVTINDSRITTDHVLVRCEFTNNAGITALTAWNTNTAGQLTISGTCRSATTAEITLVKKNN